MAHLTPKTFSTAQNVERRIGQPAKLVLEFAVNLKASSVSELAHCCQAMALVQLLYSYFRLLREKGGLGPSSPICRAHFQSFGHGYDFLSHVHVQGPRCL